MKQSMKFPIYVILNNIRSAYNVGSFFRTSDAARIKKLYLCGITCYPPHNRIPKTALGATETVPWEYEKDIFKVLNYLKKEKAKIVAVETHKNAVNYTDFEYQSNTALIFGHELSGIDPDILDQAGSIVQIPMYGMKKSLNVSVSFGIVLFEVLRQFREKGIIKQLDLR